jgi:polysaccharide export outer membrane protein
MLNPGSSGGGNLNTSQIFGSGVGQYINGYQVATDSTISIPILGNLKVAGLTRADAEDLLQKKAEEYLKDPSVQVKLLNYKLNVLGEVNSPGVLYNYEGSINIIDALAMSGGITKFANLKQIVVNRQIDNVMNSYKVDLTNNNLYKSNVFYLQPNDVVYVPPSKLVMRSENVGNYSIFLSTITSLFLIVSFFGINK